MRSHPSALTSACPSWAGQSSTLEKINKEAQAESVLGQLDSLPPRGQAARPSERGQALECQSVNRVGVWRPQPRGLSCQGYK